MSATSTPNGYQVKLFAPGQWWVIDSAEAQVAGPFDSELTAITVASVFQDQPEPPARRRNKKS